MSRWELILFMMLACTVGAAAGTEQTERVASIGRGTFSITIPESWKIELKSGWESENYVVSVGGTPLFFIFRGDNPDLAGIHRGKAARAIKLNSLSGTEFRLDGKVTDVLLTPPCGPDRYVWIRIVDTRSENRDAIANAIRTFDCADHRTSASPLP